MNVIVVGNYLSNNLTPDTIHVLNTLDSLETDISIDLILLSKDLKQTTLKAPSNVTIYNYPNFKGDLTLCYKEVLLQITNKQTDLIIVALQDNNDQIVPSIGEKLQIESFLDITNLQQKNQNLLLTKPEYSGNVDAYYLLKGPAILSFRYHKGDYLQSSHLRQQTVHHISKGITVQDPVLKRTILSKDSNELKDAEIVLVCGFGVGSKENVNRIIQYAHTIGATVAGTKKVIDSGWLPVNRLIGQTGQIISPQLCITIGVSGAAPLLNGILDSKTIVAINKDINARIFHYADYGIVGDYQTILQEGFDLL